jgi:hypothetical protein
MKKNLLSSLVKAAGCVGITLLSLTNATAQQYVTVENLNAPDTWIAYGSWFLNNGNYESGQPLTYDNGSTWGVADVKSVLDATANTIALYPNYNTYDPASTTWSDGQGHGNRIFEGSTYVERRNLAGEQLVFSGKTVSTTLLPAFKDIAYIKVLNPDAGYSTDFIVTANLVAGENFTLSTAGFVIQPGRVVQYGFSVTGLNANPTQMAANGFTVVTADEPQVNEGNVVTLDASSPLIGYATWYQLDGTSWIGGESVANLAELKTTKNTANNTIVLQPNFSRYASADPAWISGDTGSRIYEANSYILNDALLGQTITFKGHTLSNTLATGYVATAVVKVLNADYSTVLLEQVAPLVTGEDFSITVNTAIAGGAHVQYGFMVKGRNANPTQEAALGSTIIGESTAGVAAFATASTKIYPNPATTVLNIASDNVIETASVYNVLGQKVIDRKVNAAQGTLDVSGLNSGVYIINTSANGQVTSARFVKQ